jgi:hypothetical protein
VPTVLSVSVKVQIHAYFELRKRSG